MRRLSLILLLAVAGTVGGCGDEADSGERDGAIAAAEKLLAECLGAVPKCEQTDRDIDSGPCLSESLPGYPDWVADIAHDPRAPVDDDPSNQCQRYHDGEAAHFVELTESGELIRAE